MRVMHERDLCWCQGSKARQEFVAGQLLFFGEHALFLKKLEDPPAGNVTTTMEDSSITGDAPTAQQKQATDSATRRTTRSSFSAPGHMDGDGVYSDRVLFCSRLSFFFSDPGMLSLLFMISSLCFILASRYIFGISVLEFMPAELLGQYVANEWLESCPYASSIATALSMTLYAYMWQALARKIAKGYSLPERFTTPGQFPSWMRGKVAVVTGGNRGIGRETTRQLALWGVHVLVGCRRVEEVPLLAEQVAREHAQNKAQCKRKGRVACPSPGEIRGFYLDLCDFESVRRFAAWALVESRGKVDILLNNASISSSGKLTVEQNTGFEKHFVTNHLGPFLLTNLLIPAVKAAHGRVITVSSVAHIFGDCNFRPLDAAIRPEAAEAVASALDRPLEELQSKPITEKNYNGRVMFNTTKLANIWFTKELQRRVAQERKSRAVAYAVNPGLVCTCMKSSQGKDLPFLVKSIYDLICPLFCKKPAQAAATQLLLCMSDKEQLEGGAYYSDGKTGWVDQHALDDQKQRELWEVSEAICELN
ncbi:short chain dehydrogenase reductase family protein [Cystoisospora suis]|uniref:Short chain dehydrogenase reductase family protein n=1 Tax=Cystoisospora suis TaxID=483139 RepID=A0A2C6L6B7_9APIC|nr:short chain dehydrogenase reductase family protein [Cystoisospora suis]